MNNPYFKKPHVGTFINVILKELNGKHIYDRNV